jgi:hypothetical protein
MAGDLDLHVIDGRMNILRGEFSNVSQYIKALENKINMLEERMGFLDGKHATDVERLEGLIGSINLKKDQKNKKEILKTEIENKEVE